MYRPLILTAIMTMAVSSTVAHADTDWIPAVLDHPSLRVQHSAIEKQQWKILELQAEQGFDFDITSQGHLPILENFDTGFSRVASQNAYLDLVFSASQTLYDFGASDALIEAERVLQGRAKLAFVSSFEHQTHSLFSLVVQYQKAQQTVAVVDDAQAHISLVKNDLLRRFEAGLGTLGDIRRTQLSQIDLETQLIQLFNKMDEIEHIITSDYGLSVSQLLPIWQALEPQFKLVDQLDEASLRSSAISRDAQQSLRHQRNSIMAQKQPKLVLDVNTTLYDVTRSLSNYRVAGEFRLTFPAFDSGYRDAKMASISHGILTESQTFDQLLQQKKLDLNTNTSQLDDLALRQNEGTKKHNNLSQQLANAKLALGVTSNDHAGLANLHTQIASAKIALVGITSDMQQLALDRLLLSEQIIQQFNVSSDLFP